MHIKIQEQYLSVHWYKGTIGTKLARGPQLLWKDVNYRKFSLVGRTL
jgi:hypothetical protein